MTRVIVIARSSRPELLEARIAPALAFSPSVQFPAGIEAGHAVDFFNTTTPGSAAASFQDTAAATANPAFIGLGSLSGGDGFTLFGATASQFLGSSVGSAGDVNGDGYDDIVATGGGSSYVVFGKAGGFPAGLTTAQLDGTNGFSVNAGKVAARHVGDFDGDGVDDLLIGDGYSAYLIRGHRGAFPAALNVDTLDGVNGFRITGLILGEYSQQQIDGAGDVNGDGYADLLLASPSFFGGASVIFGRAGEFPASLAISTLNGTTGFQFQGLEVGSFTGEHVAGLGDINGDGYGDIGIGSSGDFSRRGEIFVIYGHAGAFPATMTPAALDCESFRGPTRPAGFRFAKSRPRRTAHAAESRR